MDCFMDYAKYYDALYQDKEYADEVEKICRLLKDTREDVKDIINFGVRNR